MKNVSVHISNKKSAITTMKKLRQIEKHNTRSYKSQEYDSNKIIEFKNDENSFEKRFYNCLEKVIKKEYFEDYNKNKKKSRKIRNVKDYVRKLENQEMQRDLAIEMIVQVADLDYYKSYSEEKKKQMSTVYKEYLDYFENRFKDNIKVISATVHLDENSPHMHVVGIPIVHKHKNGLEVQINKSKVFTKETLTELQNESREVLEKSMIKNFDKNFKLEDKQEGRNYDYNKSDLIKKNKEFREFNKVEEIKEKKKHIVLELNELKSVLQELERFEVTDIFKNKRIEKLKVKLQKNKIDIEEFSRDVKEEIKEITKEINEIEIRVDKIDLSDTTINEKFKSLSKKEKKKIADEIRNEYENTEEFKEFVTKVKEKYRKAMYEKIKRKTTQKQLVEELKNKKKEYEEKLKDINIEKEEIRKEKSELEIIKKERIRIREEITELKDTIEKKEKTIININNEIKEMNTTTINLQVLINQIEDKKKIKEEELKAFEENLEKAKNESHKKLELKEKELRFKINDYEEIIKRQEKELNENQSEIELLNVLKENDLYYEELEEMIEIQKEMIFKSEEMIEILKENEEIEKEYDNKVRSRIKNKELYR